MANNNIDVNDIKSSINTKKDDTKSSKITDLSKVNIIKGK